MQTYRTKILSTGVYHPKKIMTNDDIAQIVETSDEWITERTGIKQRHIAATDGTEFPSDMAVEATKMALENAGLEPNDIECILFNTVTPDYTLPNTACILQTKLGITNKCAAVDLAAACSGFVYGFNMANSMIQTGLFKTVLVVGSEMISNRVDWEDRKTCILFGDGCGVAILGRNEDEKDDAEVLSAVMSADGAGKDFFYAHGGGAVKPFSQEVLEKKEHLMQMQGQEMFKVAVRTMAENAQKCLDMANVKAEEVTYVVPHQANLRIIDATVRKIGMSMDKVMINIEKYGNTSSATVPMAFHEAVEQGKIKRGDIVLFDAFGAGLTAAACLFRY